MERRQVDDIIDAVLSRLGVLKGGRRRCRWASELAPPSWFDPSMHLDESQPQILLYTFVEPAKVGLIAD